MTKNKNKMTQEMIILTKPELESIIYRAVNAANNQLYDGLTKRYFGQFEEDLRLILNELYELRN